MSQLKHISKKRLIKVESNWRQQHSILAYWLPQNPYNHKCGPQEWFMPPPPSHTHTHTSTHTTHITTIPSYDKRSAWLKKKFSYIWSSWGYLLQPSRYNPLGSFLHPKRMIEMKDNEKYFDFFHVFTYGMTSTRDDNSKQQRSRLACLVACYVFRR